MQHKCNGKAESSKRAAYPQALGDYLSSQPWTLWTTISTPYELTMPGARRAIGRFFDRTTNNYKGVPIRTFWAAEKFDVKDGFHLHTLWHFDEMLWKDYKSSQPIYSQFVKDWRKVTKSDKAAIYSERYKPNYGAEHYLGKYITKQITDYDFFNSLSVHKDFKSTNIEPLSKIGRNASAKRKFQKLCEKYEEDPKQVMKDFIEELNDNKTWYENTDKFLKTL